MPPYTTNKSGVELANSSGSPIPARFVTAAAPGVPDYDTSPAGLKILNGDAEPVNFLLDGPIPGAAGWGTRGVPATLKREIIWIDANSPSTVEDGSMSSPYKTLPGAFATIEQTGTVDEYNREVTMMIAPAIYGDLAAPVEFSIPAGRFIRMLFFGHSIVNDIPVIRADPANQYTEQANLWVMGVAAISGGPAVEHEKTYKRFGRTIFMHPFYAANASAVASQPYGVHLENVEFWDRCIVMEPAGAVDSTWSGAPLFFGPYYSGALDEFRVWLRNVSSRLTTAGGAPTPGLNYFAGDNLAIMDASNSILSQNVKAKYIARAQHTVFDCSCTLTATIPASEQWYVQAPGFYACKFRTRYGIAVNFNAPAGSWRADRMTVKLSTGITFAGGAGLADVFAEAAEQTFVGDPLSWAAPTTASLHAMVTRMAAVVATLNAAPIP